MLLALNVGERRLALGVEAVEFHVEPFVGRHAGVDGAANLAARCGHLLLRLRNPKKAGPFQRTFVIARAIADSDL